MALHFHHWCPVTRVSSSYRCCASGRSAPSPSPTGSSGLVQEPGLQRRKLPRRDQLGGSSSRCPSFDGYCQVRGQVSHAATRKNCSGRQIGLAAQTGSPHSEMAKLPDEHLAAFRRCPLDAGSYTFVAADAVTVKVGEGWANRQRRRPGGPRGERCGLSGSPARPGGVSQRRCRVVGVLPRPERLWPSRGFDAHLQCRASG